MSALAGALLFVVLNCGPNQVLIYDQLARRDAVDRRLLPIEPLYEITRQPLYLVFHQRKDWRRAFYLGEAAPALPAERSLPDLRVPRLYLYGPHYLKDGRLADLRDLPVDSASNYYQALLERRFATRLADPAFAARARSRADLLFAEVPEADRLEVYGNTLAEFGGHLMSIAGELGRAKRRGTDICPRKNAIPLLEQWRRAFADGPFAGSYSPPGSFETLPTRQVLALEDKKLAAADLLGRFRWNGEPVADLPVCRP